MAFTERYAVEEREALAHAVVDRGIRPARHVVELAAAGELEWNGRLLPAFGTTESTVRTLAGQLRRRRAGEVKSELASMPARDAVETLRRRLVNAADAGMAAIEREQRRAGGRVKSWAEVREVARAVREIRAIPDYDDPRPLAPGEGTGAARIGGETRGGLAAKILRAHRSASAPPPPEKPRVVEAPEPAPAEEPSDGLPDELHPEIRAMLVDMMRTQREAEEADGDESSEELPAA